MSSRSSTADYLDEVRETFAALKRAGAAIALEGGGRLAPVTEADVEDSQLLDSLSRWRERSAFAFPFPVDVTPRGMARGMRAGLLECDDRMLWLVVGADGRAIGHVGYANALNQKRELELDNVVRGEPGHPGLMSAAVRAVTDWAWETLGAARISLRVFADNEHAVRFYRRLGWEEAGRTPLRRSEEAGLVYFDAAEDGEPADRELIRMALR